MQRNQIIFGVLLLGLGLLLLFGVILKIDVWSLICPLFLIGVGVLLLLAPKMSESPLNIKLIGDYRRRGVWDFDSQDIWLLIGDVVFDLSETEIPEGETKLRVHGFVGSVKMRVPEGIGVELNSTAFVTDARLIDQKQNIFISPVNMRTPGYEESQKKIRLETLYFVGDIKIDRV